MVENMDDTRVPVFVVLEEAHNFIPEEPRNRAQAALRDQFRTIAAEGRKYGLFLILVSQRPDKLDHLILS
jgi:DNA helicase HerA-like ATPase